MMNKIRDQAFAAVKKVYGDSWIDLDAARVEEIRDITCLLVECAVRRASGEDVSVAEQALKAALTNWEMVVVLEERRRLIEAVRAGVMIVLESMVKVAAGLL